jgi:antitoxin ParD1/3/4
METIDVSLPDPLKQFVEDLVARGDFSSASDYIRALIREDQKRREKEKLEALLLEGLNSGPATEMTPDDWEAIRREVRQRLAQQQDPAYDPKSGTSR